jgi:NAD(P)-dependent dehydrogenase (short-subunit alcohol dehydrogenase family)
VRPAPLGDLATKVAVVTGALGRLGPVWAGALLDAGARVIGLDIRTGSSGSLEATLAAGRAENFALIEADITDHASVQRALDLCQARFGAPDILVNNAGIDQPPSASAATWKFGDIPDAASAAVLSVNAHGTLRVCQVFGSEMARHGRGSVINIGSLYATAAPDPRLYDHLPADPPFIKPPAYGMSKAGVVSLSRYLAALWGPSGIRVNTLSPGSVLDGQDEQFRSKFSYRVPLRRMAQMDDLTGPLLFLASDMSCYVTGTELVVDGGYLCW